VLDSVFQNNLIVNDQFSNTSQPIKLFQNKAQLFESKNGVLSGLIVNKWNSRSDNQLTVLYNDSALFSMPYLINTISNFYSNVDKMPQINATISAWPKLNSLTDLALFDPSIFSSLIILGIGLLAPLVSFAVEIVHDKEVFYFPLFTLTHVLL
jgi:hypothetical protein